MEVLARRSWRGARVALHHGLLALCIAFVALACSEDTVDIPEELRGDPYCALIIGTYGHYADGNRWLIVDYDQDWVTGGCVCGDEAEVYSGARDEELNVAALDECERQAAKKDFVWDECQEDYESRQWLDLIVLAEGDDAHVAPVGFGCVGS